MYCFVYFCWCFGSCGVSFVDSFGANNQETGILNYTDKNQKNNDNNKNSNVLKEIGDDKIINAKEIYNNFVSDMLSKQTVNGKTPYLLYDFDIKICRDILKNLSDGTTGKIKSTIKGEKIYNEEKKSVELFPLFQDKKTCDKVVYDNVVNSLNNVKKVAMSESIDKMFESYNGNRFAKQLQVNKQLTKEKYQESGIYKNIEVKRDKNKVNLGECNKLLIHSRDVVNEVFGNTLKLKTNITDSEPYKIIELLQKVHAQSQILMYLLDKSI